MHVPDKSKLIDGAATNISVHVADDGVWLGFFTKDGKVALVNLDTITAALPPDSLSVPALATWASDRRDHEARIAG